MAFLHGVKTLYLNAGGASITDIPTALVGIVGTAAKGAPNTPTLINSDVNAAAVFGTRAPGYTIPYALDALFDHGAATAIVINVLTTPTVVTPAPMVFSNADTIAIAGKQAISALTVKNTGATVTYILGTDYTVDLDAAIITRLSTGTILAGASVQVGYSWLDPSVVVPADIIGTVTGAGVRTGMLGFLDSFAKYGLEPTILIAPGFTPLIAVSSALIAIATQLQSFCLIDAPIGVTRDQALAGRNGTAPVSNFNTSNIRTGLCFPYLKTYDTATNTEILEPFSQRLAGVMAQTDNNFGFWYSPSNKEIQGITGVERLLDTSFTNPSSDSNILNAAGIISYLQTYGGGVRTWGNRSAAYPTTTTPDNFIAVQRVRDIIAKGIRAASLQFLDRPINKGLIDAIIATILGYFAEKTMQGALLPGSKCLFLPGDNPPTSIAAGTLIFTTIILPPPPAEQIIDKQILDISLAANLVA